MRAPLSDKLPLRYILVQGKAGKTSEALEAVSHLLEGHPGVKDFARFKHDLLEREKQESTCLGNELALPHARTDAVREMVLAAGAYPDGMAGDGGQTVRLVFVIGTPTGEVTEYLKAVGGLARIMKSESVRRRLATAKNPEEFLRVFREAESEI